MSLGATAIAPRRASGGPFVSGTYDVDWDADFDRDDFGEPHIVGAHPTVNFFPSRLGCRACGLRLNDLDELLAAGIARSWQMEDVDTDALLAAYQDEWADFEP